MAQPQPPPSPDTPAPGLLPGVPDTLLTLAALHRLRQQVLAGRLSTILSRLWTSLDTSGSVQAAWDRSAGQIAVQLMATVKIEAARGAQEYVTASVAAWGATSDPAGTPNSSAYGRSAADGRPLDSLLSYPAFQVDAFLSDGMDRGTALAVGQRHLERIAVTEIQDAARVATGVAQVNDRTVHGWVRMLTPPSCSRCVVLAGKFYWANRGFERHPLCDCVHIPAVEYLPGISTDPRRYFDSLDPRQQDQTFTRSGAQAIRDGADIGQVVNARRGATGLGYARGRLTAAERTMLRGGRQRGHLDTTKVFNHDLFITSEATTTRGIAGVRLGAKETGKKAGGRYRKAQIPRLMPESIYAEAERLGWSRDEIVRQLKRFGYIL